MHLPHFAKRPVITIAALSLVLAACGDSTAPDAPFDPAGTSADMATIDNVFQSEAFTSFDAAANEMNAVLGGAVNFAIAARPSANVVSRRSAAAWYSQKIARSFRRGPGGGPSFASSAIPEEFVGKTFEYNPESGDYEPTDRAGAPGNGVRFILYSVNQITGVPTEPLTEVGYAQVVVTESSSASVMAVSAHLSVVSGNVTYLDYSVGVTGNPSNETATFSLDGFVTNGTDQANFDLTFQFSPAQLALNFLTEVPTRGFRVSMSFAFQNLESGDVLLTLSLQARGEHGRLSITGSTTNDAGALTVRVNGDVFATMTFNGTADPVITGANGQPLSEDDLQALRDVFGLFDGSSSNLFNHLPGPVA